VADTGRLLIVDDEESVREVLSDYFVDRGYAVITASDGPGALAAFARERPDIVLLDIRMPGLDGLNVLKRLREADPDVAVIMVTANEDVDLARQTLSVGAFDYVAKPFDFEHLDRAVVAAALRSSRTAGTPDGVPPHGSGDPWTRLAVDVFRAVRRMDPDARASTGTRLEDAALAAARQGWADTSPQTAGHLAEIMLLVTVASRLGDLSPASRFAIETAVKSARSALPTR
jgi:two-component system, response regulator, stage 0 sporulation protein F